MTASIIIQGEYKDESFVQFPVVSLFPSALPDLRFLISSLDFNKLAKMDFENLFR